MKGQINFEFLVAAIVYLSAIGGVLFASSAIPSFQSSTERANSHMEARAISNHLITQPGYYETSTTGTDWEESEKRIKNLESVGLADSSHRINRQKLEQLQTVTVQEPETKVNYTRFREIMDVENEYKLTFVWFPTSDTHRDFTKGNPPSDPDEDGQTETFIEPKEESYAERAGNKVNYGQLSLRGVTYNILVASHNETYDTVRINNNGWDFEDNTKLSEGQTRDLGNQEYTLHRIQNRDREQGAAVMFKKEIKEFGSSPGNKETVRLARYATMSSYPLRVEVLAW